jgi:hypothetical protein
MDAACLREVRRWIANTEAVTAAGNDRPDMGRGTFSYVRVIRFMENILVRWQAGATRVAKRCMQRLRALQVD